MAIIAAGAADQRHGRMRRCGCCSGSSWSASASASIFRSAPPTSPRPCRRTRAAGWWWRPSRCNRSAAARRRGRHRDAAAVEQPRRLAIASSARPAPAPVCSCCCDFGFRKVRAGSPSMAARTEAGRIVSGIVHGPVPCRRRNLGRSNAAARSAAALPRGRGRSLSCSRGAIARARCWFRCRGFSWTSRPMASDCSRRSSSARFTFRRNATRAGGPRIHRRRKAPRRSICFS